MKPPQTCPRIAAVAAVAVLALTLTPAIGSAAETTLWDWGGEKKVASSGREMVRMTAANRPGDIIVSFSDRKLYFITKPGEAISYPIATPREQSRWQGVIQVTQKRENPSWTPTPEMRAENPKLPYWVPGGHPMNPLGVRALYLGASAYRIHGTDAPWTIGSAVSKGCVRMFNQDVADLYPRVRVGASVLVTWEKFKSTPDATLPVPAIAEVKGSQPSSRVKTGSIQLRPEDDERQSVTSPEKSRTRDDAATSAKGKGPAKSKPQEKKPPSPEILAI
jgi:lipoprotein-anchoring transpeptidase ErfK/SrfK